MLNLTLIEISIANFQSRTNTITSTRELGGRVNLPLKQVKLFFSSLVRR